MESFVNGLELTNRLSKDTFMEALGIEFIKWDRHSLLARMTIHPGMHQPMGCLHGGALTALAESTASMLSLLCIDRESQSAVGIEVSASFIRSKKEGVLFARAEMLHMGKSTHVIQIHMHDELESLIAYCKMTNMIILKNSKH